MTPEPIETFTVGDTTVEIHQDPDPEDPRNWDNLGTMVCFHRRYGLGDDHPYRSEDYAGWAEVEAAILADHPDALILPIFIYDHSGITVSTTPFNDPWDSGRVGLIFVSRDDVLAEWSAKRLTKGLREQAAAVLMQEVETYDEYLTGRVTGFVVKNAEGNHLDSCWGIFGGLDYVREQGRQAAEAFATPALAL